MARATALAAAMAMAMVRRRLVLVPLLGLLAIAAMAAIFFPARSSPCRATWQSVEPYGPGLLLPRPNASEVVPCSDVRRDTDIAIPARSNGYMTVTLRGGFNQQRKGAANAVVLARLLNATLVVPALEEHEVWKVAMKMDDVFDVDWFITSLKGDVEIVRTLPPNVEPKCVDSSIIYEVANYLTIEAIAQQILPLLLQDGSLCVLRWHVQLVENLPLDLQRLRCRANFHALRFLPNIQNLGRQAIQKLRRNGPYVTLHMRFEPDWLVHSGCKYDEKTLKAYGDQFCPLSPLEVAMILKVMGIDPSVPIYVAGGTVAGGAAAFAPLLDAFKGQVTNKGELLRKSKDLVQYGAAIDHLVAVNSDLLVLTDGRSNWGHVVEGERGYFHGFMKETLVLDPQVFWPFFQGETVDMKILGLAVAAYRGSYWQSGCRREKINPSVGFCYPMQCMCDINSQT